MKRFKLIFTAVFFIVICLNVYSLSALGASDILPAESAEVLYTEALSFDIEAGTAPALPQTVKVLMSDGKIAQKGVVWDKSGFDVNKIGKVQIIGKVEDTDVPAYCTINVIKTGGDNPTVEIPDVTVSGSIHGLKKPIIKLLSLDDSALDAFKVYVKDPNLLRGYSICNNDGTLMSAEGENTKFAIEIGNEHNGEVWTLLKIVDEQLHTTPCTVEQGKLNVTANGTSMNVVFLMPTDDKNALISDNGTSDNTEKSGDISKNESNKKGIFNKIVLFLLLPLGIIILLFAAILSIGKKSSEKEVSTGIDEKNPVLNICKKLYIFASGIFKLKDGKKPDIYSELEEESKEIISDNEEAEPEIIEEEDTNNNEAVSEENIEE